MLTKLHLARLKNGLRQIDIERLSLGAVKQRRFSDIERGMAAKPDEAKTLSEIFGISPKELGVSLSEDSAC